MAGLGWAREGRRGEGRGGGMAGYAGCARRVKERSQVSRDVQWAEGLGCRGGVSSNHADSINTMTHPHT